MRRSGASCAFRYALDLTDEEEAGQPWYLRQLLRRQRRAKISIPRGTNGSHTCMGVFLSSGFLFVAGSLFGAERLFLVPSPAIRFAERAEGVKGPKC